MNYFVADDYSEVIRFVYDDVRLVFSCIFVTKVTGKGYGEGAEISQLIVPWICFSGVRLLLLHHKIVHIAKFHWDP